MIVRIYLPICRRFLSKGVGLKSNFSGDIQDIRRRHFLIGGAGVFGVALSGCAINQKAQHIFDAHCHIIDPRFPITVNQGYTPPIFTLTQYLKETKPLDISSGAIVSGSFQGFDQTYLKATLPTLGPNWVGVTQVPKNISDNEIIELSKIQVRGVRFNVYRGNVDAIDDVVALAKRVNSVGGWHAEIYADASDLAPHVSKLSKLPRIVIDHLGMTEKGLPITLDLVDAGAFVKATGFGRVDMNIPRALEQIAARNPNALVFGTDLPSTRAKRPFEVSDIELIKMVLGQQLAENVLWKNGRILYRL